MRVLSVVPRAADDIRDASGQTFAAVETRRFRATAWMVAAAIAFAAAVVLAGLALVRLAGRVRRHDPKQIRPLPTPSLLRGCLRELDAVRAEAAGAGWTPELRARAMAALRVAAAVAIGKPVAQQFVNGEARERAGQLAVRTGVVRRKRAILSAATTPGTIARGLNNGHVRGAQARVNAEQISDALRVFSAASYGRTAPPESSALNGALDSAVAAIRKVRVGTLWPMRTAQAVARSLPGLS
jgi:hypothetical protein